MEKFTTEQIEQYLEDKLNVNERLEMEAAMALNPELKEEVLLQQALVQKIEDQALRALAKDAHLRYMKGNSGSGFMNGKWIFGITLAVVALAALLFYVIKTETHKIASNTEETTGTSTEAGSMGNEAATLPVVKGVLEKIDGPLPQVPFTAYILFAERGAVIKDPRSGAVIKVQPNSLVHSNGTVVKGKVLLKYREFRNQADIALSGIPMTYKDQNFNSAGMFEIVALQNGDTLSINDQSAVSIDFVMTKNEPGIGFYQLDKLTQQWDFIRALGQEEIADFGQIGGVQPMGEKRKESFGFSQGDSKDAFLRSLGYQTAAIEGKTNIPEMPEKPQNDFNKQYADPNYKQIAGSDTKNSNRILVMHLSEAGGGSGGKGSSGFFDFFKRIFSTGNGVALSLNNKEEPKLDTVLSIVANGEKYTIKENGKDIVMTELTALNGAQFVYKGTYDFTKLEEKEFYDVRFIRDTTALNKFVLELKTDGNFMRFPLQLTELDFAISEYNKQQSARMMGYDSRVRLKEQEYQDLIKLREERKNLIDSLSFYGNESVFRMARLIMTEDELRMNQEEWFASLDTNKTLRARINAALDSIEAYGDNADAYIYKLAKERNQNVRKAVFNPQVDPGHYFNPLVVNLKIKGFGVYNCDQVYQIQHPISVRGRYVNEANVEIKNFISISVIDAKINGAFSFDPAAFTCNAATDNMLLLFTRDNRIYFFDKTKWNAKQIKKGGSYTFEMIDITARAKTSEDLQRVLEAEAL